jgi:nucleotide-binding universal stress UspA family protein
VAALVSSCSDESRVLLVRSAVIPDTEIERGTPANIRPMEEAEAYLRAIAAPLAQTGLNVSAVTSHGSLADAILSQLGSESVDLIAMATHGRWGPDRLVHGSLAEEIVAAARVPVLLFGPDTRIADRVQRLLIPLDGGPFTAAVLPEAGRFVRSFGIQQVDLLAVLPPQTVHMDDLEGIPPAWALEKLGLRRIGSTSAYALDERQPLVRERLQELEHALDYWSDWLGRSDADVRIHVRYGQGLGSTAASVLAAANELQSDLIVMRTHARRGLSRALTGSVADEVGRTSPLPVLLYTSETIEALVGSAPSTTVQTEATS